MIPASLIATLSSTPSPDGKELASLSLYVEFLELPAGLASELSPEWIRHHFRGEPLYELSLERDLNEASLRDIPVANRIVSWYGHAANVAQLQSKFAELAAVPARFYKLVNTATSISEEFLPLTFLKSLNRTDTIAYANGTLGFWSRLVALQLGAPAILGLASPGPNPSEPTVAKLIADYGLPE